MFFCEKVFSLPDQIDSSALVREVAIVSVDLLIMVSRVEIYLYELRMHRLMKVRRATSKLGIIILLSAIIIIRKVYMRQVFLVSLLNIDKYLSQTTTR